MATNLRLRPEAETALRAEAARVHRSQQDILRDAVDRYLGLGRIDIESPNEPVHGVVVSTSVKRARSPMRHASRLIALPPTVTSSDLLNRDDRL